MALRVLQVGALAVVLVAVTNREYDLDRFYVPKELALHLTALAAGLLGAAAFRRVRLGWVDLLLGAYLLLGAVSAAFAVDRLLAARALAVSVSGAALFWTAGALREAGLTRPLLRALAFAAVLGVATSLVQAYGVESDFFSINRAPGGTLGNRNSIAHMAAFAAPVILLVALRAWRTAGYLLAATGTMVAIGALVLTRSRAGWLAFAAVLAVLAAAFLLARPLRRHRRSWLRLAGLAALAGAGIAGAILLPNTLEWRSENPYLETMAGIANYQEGSGRGRLVQYGRSMEMAIDHPLLGVGPGNWPEVYPDYAEPGDPSMDRSDPDETANPWPSSDWVAFVSERGFPAAVLLALVVAGIGLSGVRRLVGARDADEALVAAALVATLAGAVVAGMFDAVLLLAHPTLLVWTAVGALWTRKSEPEEAEPEEAPPGRARALLLTAVAVAAGVGAALSVLRLTSM